MSGIVGGLGADSGITQYVEASPSIIEQDNYGGVSFPKNPGFRANRNTSVRVNYDAYAIILMNDEAYDTDNSYDQTTGKFTAKVAGKYFAHAQMQVNINGDTSHHASCHVIKNSANQDGLYMAGDGCKANGSGSSNPHVAGEFELAVGDTLEMGGNSSWNNASSTTYGDASHIATYFAAQKIA